MNLILTHALSLVGAWFAISLVVMLLGGTRLRLSHAAVSLFWLVVVLGLGDVWALTAFRPPRK